MATKKADYLAKVGFLSELNTRELNELADDFYWDDYSRGTNITIQGQESNQFFVIAEGKTEVLESNQRGEQIKIDSFGPGDAFGFRAILTGGIAPFTVRCLDNCKVLVMSEEHFAQMLVRWPSLYNKFIKTLSKNLDKASIGLWEARNKEYLHAILQNTQYENKFYGLWGSPKTTKLMESKLTELSLSREHLLLIGERGTGRQMMAWYLHKSRFGESAPFVVMSGRDLEKQWGDQIFETESQEESSARNSSLLEYVAGGTLFIKEIDQLSPRMQLKLAEVLHSHKNNYLVIGSLQSDPELLAPQLRELFTDLFKITPLRDRKRDIPFLAQGLLEKLARKHNRKTPSLDHEATKLLLSHNYRQGNVTELIQVIERAFFLAEHDLISLEHVFFGPTAKKVGGTFDLLSFPWVEKLIKKGVFVLWLQRTTAIVFILIILLLLAAPKATIAFGLFALVWGLWWPTLAMISPFLGRVWCTVCPFSYVMDLVQKKIHWNHPVPDFIKKYDYLLITILFLSIFWIEVVFNLRSYPTLTGVLLITIFGAAILTGIIFVRHTWCRHLCPLGGFVGMASIGAMLEIRADSTVCLNKCTTFDCYKGSAAVAGCPMFQYAPFVDNSFACKMCFNCVRNCSNGAVKFNLRIPAREVWHLVRVNQGFVIFIMASLAILFPINYFEPLRETWPLGKWVLWFNLSYWGSAVLAGALTWLIARPFQTKAASKRIKTIFSFIPLVIAGHIIYQLHFLPGLDSILLGIGYKTTAGDIRSIDISLIKLGQLLAGLVGLILTGFAYSMVILRSGKNSSAVSTSDNIGLAAQINTKANL